MVYLTSLQMRRWMILAGIRPFRVPVCLWHDSLLSTTHWHLFKNLVWFHTPAQLQRQLRASLHDVCELEGVALHLLYLLPIQQQIKEASIKVLSIYLFLSLPYWSPLKKLALTLELKLVVWVTNPNLDFVKQNFWMAAWGIIMYYKLHGDDV